MRSPLSALAVLALAATPAFAQETVPESTPESTPNAVTVVPAVRAPMLTLVEVFETNQALVFDQVERQFLVVRTGSAVQGFRVASVHSQQIELVNPNDPSRSYIVTLPAPRSPRHQPAEVSAPEVSSAPAEVSAPGEVSAPSAPAIVSEPTASPAPEPPAIIAPPAAASTDGPIDPYAGATRLPPEEITVVRAPKGSRPPDAGEEPPREPAVVSAPAPAPAPAPSETATSAPEPAPAPNPAVEPAPTRAAVLARRDLDTALANLDELSSRIELELGSGGVVVKRVKPGSLGHRLGLRAGDVIRSIAGVPTRRLEDGADVYVKLGQVERFDIAISRGGKKLALPVVIK
jgi:hypothetical protein